MGVALKSWPPEELLHRAGNSRGTGKSAAARQVVFISPVRHAPRASQAVPVPVPNCSRDLLRDGTRLEVCHILLPPYAGSACAQVAAVAPPLLGRMPLQPASAISAARARLAHTALKTTDRCQAGATAAAAAASAGSAVPVTKWKRPARVLRPSPTAQAALKPGARLRQQ